MRLVEPFLRELRGEYLTLARRCGTRCWSRYRTDPAVSRLGDVLSVARPGFVQPMAALSRQVTRCARSARDDTTIFGDKAGYIHALVRKPTVVKGASWYGTLDEDHTSLPQQRH
jgi:hypothetical protein